MKYAVSIMLLFLASCKSNGVKGNDAKNNNVADVAECDVDFDIFFRKFAGDSVFQKRHFDFPVMEYHSDEDFPLDLMEGQISEESYNFMDLNTDKMRYDVSVEKKKDSVIYTRTLRDIHHLPMIYKFARKNNCWMLVEFRDLTD